MRDTDVAACLQGLLEQRSSRIEIVLFHCDIPKIRKGLRVLGIDRQLALEFGLGIIILLQLPVQVAEAKMYVLFLGSSFYGLLELRNGFRSPSQAVEGFSHQDVSRCRIWVALLDLAELLESAVVFLRPQAALRKYLTQLNIVWIGLRRQLK